MDNSLLQTRLLNPSLAIRVILRVSVHKHAIQLTFHHQTVSPGNGQLVRAWRIDRYSHLLQFWRLVHALGRSGGVGERMNLWGGVGGGVRG